MKKIKKVNKYEIKLDPQKVEIESINKGLNIMGEYDIEVRMLCPICKKNSRRCRRRKIILSILPYLWTKIKREGIKNALY